jgi:hypothetical protein
MAGGIAATIGNAHAVEDMIIGHSIAVLYDEPRGSALE